MLCGGGASGLGGCVLLVVYTGLNVWGALQGYICPGRLTRVLCRAYLGGAHDPRAIPLWCHMYPSLVKRGVALSLIILMTRIVEL